MRMSSRSQAIRCLSRASSISGSTGWAHSPSGNELSVVFRSALRYGEWRAVVAGVRACSVAIRSPEGFLDDAPRWAEAGLSALPVEMTGVSGQPYSATGVPLRPGEPFAFRLVVRTCGTRIISAP